MMARRSASRTSLGESPSSRLLREIHRREEFEICAVEDEPLEVRGDELRPLAVHEDDPGSVVLADQIIELRPDRVSGCSEWHPACLVDQTVVAPDIEVRLVVVADSGDVLTVEQDV